MIATGSTNGLVSIYDSRIRHGIGHLEGHIDSVLGVRF